MKRLLSAVLIFLLKVYQKVISPLYSPSCRYYPTCSSYGVEAIRKHGPLKGGYLSLKRICSCHPWGGHGYDPVP